MKFVLFVEGQTEKLAISAFLKRSLDSQLSNPIGIQIVQFQGSSQFQKDIRQKVWDHLEGPRGTEIVAAIGLLDLYGLTFPKTCLTISDKYDSARREIEKEVGHRQFHMFFAVHELEAWLLSSPEIFPAAIQARFTAQIDRPETINFDRTPAKLLRTLYRKELRREYKKTTDGRTLFKKLKLPKDIQEKCPFLHGMLQTMLDLAKKAGL